MIQLFLSEPTCGDENISDESCKRRISFLNDLETAIWSLMSSLGARSEARLWLCNSLSGIKSISPRRQRELFVNFLRSKPVKQHLASQLLQLIFEKRPKKVGTIIAKKSLSLEKFFRGNPRRILQWFSNFTGDSEHSKGAKALSQFAFINRDICWEELEWKGKHGKSPAMVATKPHYFLDLNVQQTVENFLEYVPEFWSSQEFSDSLKDGEILSIEKTFFVDMFFDLMYKDESREVWNVIEDFLADESFAFLCQHLLIVLEERELNIFLDLLPNYLKLRPEYKESDWLEIVISKNVDSTTVDQLLLLNAMTNQGRRLLRLVQEEGDDEEKNKIKNLVFKLCELSSHDNNLASLMEEGFKRQPLEFVKWLGLQSWAIHFRLSEDFREPQSLFISNGIGFRKYTNYDLLNDNEFSEDRGSHWDKGSKKHRKNRKKRRRHLDLDNCDENESLDLSKCSDWLLSTDGYTTTWSNVDLPEHFSKHCFFTWLKWVFAKWSVSA